MHLNVLRSLKELEPLAGEWNELLQNSASHVPFLRHEYLTSWYKTLGGGEWSQGELYTITARKDDGQLAGIAPLFFTRNLEGEPALMLLGSIEISDYLDLIAAPEDLSAFVEACFEQLASDTGLGWQVLDWYNIPAGSPTLAALKRAAERCGWYFTEETQQPCPVISLPGNWETYLAGIDKKQRHEIRRKIRRVETGPFPVRWYFVDDAGRLEAEIEDFLALMAHDPDKRSFLTEAMRVQMRTAARAAFDAGWLQLAFLEVDGKKAAGYLNFDYNGTIWVYNSGLDPQFRELSPGWVLLGYLLKWANENGRRAFDFMRGSEEYKYRFGAQNRYVVRATIHRQP